jgi:hypothetical protein
VIQAVALGFPQLSFDRGLMKFTGLLFFAVVGWTGLGAIGIALSLARGRRAEALKHAAWLAAVAGVYLIILFAVSVVQPQRLIPMGQDQCFDKMCFAVVGFDEVPSLVVGDSGRVVRVNIRVSNQGHSANSDSLVRAYLLDGSGRTWEPLPGLSGNRLTARVAAGAEMLSQPMFRVAQDSESLSLVFTHGHWQAGSLTIGDSDSLAHKPDAVPLKRLPEPVGPPL